jgi:tetratricopeptide (TPR) repeat protein
MRDIDDEINEIKTEIIESRGLVIKTNNLTNSLAADIKSIAKRQASYERRLTWNSGVAYLVFATLSFVGLKLWSNVRINEIESEKAELSREAAELRKDLAEETRRAEQREEADRKAANYYALIREGDRARVVEGYKAIKQEQLSTAESEFFKDTLDRFRYDLSITTLQKGLELMRTGRYAEAAESFQEAIKLKENAAHVLTVKYHLARALRKLGRCEEASLYTKEIVEQEKDVEDTLQVDAAWLMSQCAEDLGDLDRARKPLRVILRRWPLSAIIPDARKRLNELTVRIWKKQT